MQVSAARRTLAEITESQWGLVTTRQAIARGVSHMQLSRFAENGDLIRLMHGIYRDSGTPPSDLDDLRAAWLSTEPDLLAYKRLAQQPADVVVSLTSAANLHRIGDFRSTAATFTTPSRRQTQKQDIRYRTRELPEADITVVDGLPVTTMECTIADLVETREDLSTIADAYRDASLRSTLDRNRLEQLLAPLAQRNGFTKDEGAVLLNHIEELAGLDIDSMAKKIASSPELTAKVLGNILSAFPTPDLTRILGLDAVKIMTPPIRTLKIPELENIARQVFPVNLLRDQQETLASIYQPILAALSTGTPASAKVGDK
ncbi:MAG: type IV toxin-antitoxin system AbiEi family antitoxin domain-containing protein [Propionibacteriaceae bacterium]